MLEYDQLKLENQLCFPVYAASRLIIREYQPFLYKLGITYPQYLVLMVLWETDGITVNEISGKLILNTNTVTPLLKRMEGMGLIKRVRSTCDERKVLISLSDKGKIMREKAALIPLQLVEKINDESIDLNKLMELKETLNRLIGLLTKSDRY
ncbi:MarR family winged helix-turn-helix transcriptional regulator [Alkalitalea saponilacus]|uniref:DNA-binding transcriptional regulator, MarR family n=1 Tax=Alkalitalea saponilacus TaxID=889453 RepID=A0A1T5HLA2_9BACT|nr:MarR family transcriptional regulator [Alkalitalea saponilacus]ASB47810.1 MarR family transcriptional regulator [Alkalitalea saponilacus]SKC21419.1 DNA-binding transcriptional regulator, MarR family [Alkalitalea saponilacus]